VGGGQGGASGTSGSTTFGNAQSTVGNTGTSGSTKTSGGNSGGTSSFTSSSSSFSSNGGSKNSGNQQGNFGSGNTNYDNTAGGGSQAFANSGNNAGTGNYNNYGNTGAGSTKGFVDLNNAANYGNTADNAQNFANPGNAAIANNNAYGNTGTGNNQGFANFASVPGLGSPGQGFTNLANKTPSFTNFVSTTGTNGQGLNAQGGDLFDQDIFSNFGGAGVGQGSVNQQLGSNGLNTNTVSRSSSGSGNYNFNNNGVSNAGGNTNRGSNTGGSAFNNQGTVQDVFGSGKTQSSSSSSTSSGSGSGDVSNLDLFGPNRKFGSYNPFNIAGDSLGSNSHAFNFDPNPAALPPSSFGVGSSSNGYFGSPQGPVNVNSNDFRNNFDVTALKGVNNQRAFDDYYNNFNTNFQKGFDNLDTSSAAGANQGPANSQVTNSKFSLPTASGVPQGKAPSQLASPVRLQHGAHPEHYQSALKHSDDTPAGGPIPKTKFQPAASLKVVDDVEGHHVTERPPEFEGSTGDDVEVSPSSDTISADDSSNNDSTTTINNVIPSTTNTTSPTTTTFTTNNIYTTTPPTIPAPPLVKPNSRELTQPRLPAVVYSFDRGNRVNADGSEVEDDVPLPPGADTPMSLNRPDQSRFAGGIVVVFMEGEGRVL
jgi:hypothetical protein